MPAKKPKSQHRKPLIVTCSKDHKKQIDQILSNYPVRYRSKYMVEFLKDAIAEGKTDLAPKSDSFGESSQFQISMSPEDKQLIETYCQKNLPPKKRSRWIVQRILELIIDK